MNMSATARTRSEVAIQMPSATPTTSAMKKPPKMRAERASEIDREPAVGEHVEQRDHDLGRARQIERVDAGQDRDHFPGDQHQRDRAPAEHARIVEHRAPRAARRDVRSRGCATAAEAFGYGLIGLRRLPARRPSRASPRRAADRRCGRTARRKPDHAWSPCERGRGRSTAISAAMRPGRAVITRIVSASRIASSIECVTRIAVVPLLLDQRGELLLQAPAASARRATPNGSSSSSTSGSITSARARPTRWRMPPESWRGILVLEAERSTAAIALARARGAFGSRHAGEPQPELDILDHGEPGEQVERLPHRRHRRARRRACRRSSRRSAGGRASARESRARSAASCSCRSRSGR